MASIASIDPTAYAPSVNSHASFGHSVSTGSLSSRLSVDDGSTGEELEMMDGLVHDVGQLSHALNSLEATIDTCGQYNVPKGVEPTAFCVQVHDGLTRTSATIKGLLDKYAFLRCSDVLSPAANLIHTVKGLKFDGEQSEEARDNFDQSIGAIHALQSAVAERVGDYLTWEMSHYESSCLRFSQSTEDMKLISSGYQVKSQPSSSNSRAVKRRHSTFQAKNKDAIMSSEQMDSVLSCLDNGVEVAFGRAKVWSKYCSHIINFVQRRITLETDHAKQMHKLAEGTRTLIQEEDFLPLQSIFINSFKVEAEFYENCTDQMKRLYDYKFIQPLEARKTEVDKRRKELKMFWDRHLKQLSDTNEELKKARAQYSRQDAQYKKAREQAVKTEMSQSEKSKVEKRQRAEEDAMIKRQQSVAQVQTLEARMAEKYQELERCKVRILREVRELIYQCDQTTKACTVAYFQALSGLWSVLPMKYESLSNDARDYVPGMEYMQFVQQIPKQHSLWKRGLSEDDLSLLPRFNRRRGGVELDQNGTVNSAINAKGGSIALQRQHSVSTPTSQHILIDDVEPDDTSLSSFSADYNYQINGPKSDFSRMALPESSYSEAALSHSLHKVRLPSKCCHCDSYTFFQTVQCTECSMTWHKNCLPAVSVPCGPSSVQTCPRRMSMFGVPLDRHLADTHSKVPPIIVKCIHELDSRGARVKGLYRVCGVKSKIEKLCEDFERQDVDLSDVHPTNIASAIKLYLRQLPDPLLTEELYSSFLRLAKQYPCDDDTYQSIVVSDLAHIVNQLPQQNYDTLRYLVLHLKRMTWFESDNQMSATNLGIVFGPTLMWRDEDKAPLNSLLEAPLQTRVVELILQHAYDLFDVDFDEEKAKVDDGEGGVPDLTALTLADRNLYKKGGASEGIRKSATPDLLKSNRSAYERNASPPYSTSTTSQDIMLDTDGYTSQEDVTRVVVDCCSPQTHSWDDADTHASVTRRLSDDSLLAPSSSSHRSSSTPQSSPLSNADGSSYISSSGEGLGAVQKLQIAVSERCVDCGSSPSKRSANQRARFERARPIRRAQSASSCRKCSPTPTGVCITVDYDQPRQHRILTRQGMSLDYGSSDSSCSSGRRSIHDSHAKMNNNDKRSFHGNRKFNMPVYRSLQHGGMLKLAVAMKAI